MEYKLYEKLETSADNEYEMDIYDPTTVNWAEYKWDNGFYIHSISKSEILKPYLISYQYYGTPVYENLILLLNQIENIWEIPPGTKIKIPKIEDLKAFILANKI